MISKDGKTYSPGITFDDTNHDFIIPNDDVNFLRFVRLYGDAFNEVSTTGVFTDTANSWRQQQYNNQPYLFQNAHSLLMKAYGTYNRAKELAEYEYKDYNPDFTTNVYFSPISSLVEQYSGVFSKYKDAEQVVKDAIAGQDFNSITDGGLYQMKDGRIVKCSQEEVAELSAKFKNKDVLSNMHISLASPAGYNTGVTMSYVDDNGEHQLFAESFLSGNPMIQAYNNLPDTRARKKLEYWSGQNNPNINHSIYFGDSNIINLSCYKDGSGKPQYKIKFNGDWKSINNDDMLALYSESLSLRDQIRQYRNIKNNLTDEQKEAFKKEYFRWKNNDLKPLLENIFGKFSDEEFNNFTKTIYSEFFDEYFK